MKSLIMFDTPKSCDECPCSYIENHLLMCQANGYEKVSSKERPEWCPLRPLPERKYPDGYYYGWNMMAQGWNECLDAVEGKTK